MFKLMVVIVRVLLLLQVVKGRISHRSLLNVCNLCLWQIGYVLNLLLMLCLNHRRPCGCSCSLILWRMELDTACHHLMMLLERLGVKGCRWVH